MKRILVGYDGSEASHHAVEVASELAKSQKAELCVCYVSVPIVYPVEMGWVRVPEAEQAQVEYGNKLLAGVMEEFRAQGVSLQTVLEEGPAAERLLELADSKDVDCVVVGSRGRGAVARLFLGSVADRVLYLAKKPVMVVH